MLTSYDQYTAELFDEAGVWALLVGDSAGQQCLRLRDHAAGHGRGAAAAGARRGEVHQARFRDR